MSTHRTSLESGYSSEAYRHHGITPCHPYDSRLGVEEGTPIRTLASTTSSSTVPSTFSSNASRRCWEWSIISLLVLFTVVIFLIITLQHRHDENRIQSVLKSLAKSPILYVDYINFDGSSYHAILIPHVQHRSTELSYHAIVQYTRGSKEYQYTYYDQRGYLTVTENNIPLEKKCLLSSEIPPMNALIQSFSRATESKHPSMKCPEGPSITLEGNPLGAMEFCLSKIAEDVEQFSNEYLQVQFTYASRTSQVEKAVDQLVKAIETQVQTQRLECTEVKQQGGVTSWQKEEVEKSAGGNKLGEDNAEASSPELEEEPLSSVRPRSVLGSLQTSEKEKAAPHADRINDAFRRVKKTMNSRN